jgi:hypothetical protein
MSIQTTEQKMKDPVVIGLSALAWALAEPSRAERMIGLTGLDPSDLRARADDRALLAAVLGYLEAHEPDLIACAHAMGLPAPELVAARRKLDA